MKKIKENSAKTSDLKGRFVRSWHSMGVQSRIFIYFLIYTFIMIVTVWLLQIVFLDDFYKMQTRRTLREASSTIARNLDNENLPSLVQRYAEQCNLCILILDEDMNMVAEAEGQSLCLLHHLNRHDLIRYVKACEDQDQIRFYSFPLLAFRNENYDERKFVGPVPKMDEGNIQSLISVQRANAGEEKTYYIFLNAMMTPLGGTVATIRNELTFITVFLVILSFIISYLLSKRITRPIIEITDASVFLKEKLYTPIAHADYVEVQELDRRLLQAADELQRVGNTEKELIANISHDLRTPLTLVQGYAEMMRDMPEESTPENMQVIVDEANRLSTLVESVLNLNALQKGHVSSQITEFKASDCVQPMIDRYNKLLQSKDYHVLYRNEADEVIIADQVQFQQVLQNLINNAITYTGADHTVTVRQYLCDENLRFEVIDSGEGIPPEELPSIWERYYRGNKPHKRAAIGSGLGLNIVQSILKASGKRYGVSSKMGEGSTFWFEVSLSKKTE